MKRTRHRRRKTPKREMVLAEIDALRAGASTLFRHKLITEAVYVRAYELANELLDTIPRKRMLGLRLMNNPR